MEETAFSAEQQLNVFNYFLIIVHVEIRFEKWLFRKPLGTLSSASLASRVSDWNAISLIDIARNRIYLLRVCHRL